ncbi:hypothetical protein MES4922_170132 [Mesorhizobium ventifaucium]|uniref:CASP-like protein n=1 Tax=Mesorhizobium ventifaucium TaxID=666020 RepID=A0ABM9DJG3_9HYPH|nr:hypothetical protein MES4922_170132 [Mesorhizobium ventifaucium]
MADSSDCMMSLTQWQKLTARMTLKAVACAEVWLAVAGAAAAVAVVSVKAGSMVSLADAAAGGPYGPLPYKLLAGRLLSWFGPKVSRVGH